MTVNEIYEQFKSENPKLEAFCGESVKKAYELAEKTYLNGGKIMTCGNGGSAADSEHIVGELMKGFNLKRPIPENDAAKLEELFGEQGREMALKLQGALPAISLTGALSLSTAFSNDVASENVFAQQVYGYGNPGDLLIALSTSGNSANVVNAVRIAKLKGVKSIALTGEKDSQLSSLCDVTVKMPASKTYLVQEYTLPVYHVFCAMLESRFFDR